MNQDKIEKASRDLLMVVKYFKVVPTMINYLPESAQGNMRDMTIKILTALENLNEFITSTNSENYERTCRSRE